MYNTARPCRGHGMILCWHVYYRTMQEMNLLSDSDTMMHGSRDSFTHVASCMGVHCP